MSIVSFLIKKDKNKGLTLVELLIVLSILIVLVSVFVGVLNPIALVGKAKDAERKRDLDRIKKSFEEYYNDHDRYPIDIGSWNVSDNCGAKLDSFDYLNTWLCDPDGIPYHILINDSGSEFKILTNLEHDEDLSIPWWWGDDLYYRVDGYNSDQINYGVSSSNIVWYDYSLSSDCQTGCFEKPVGGVGCNSSGAGCVGPNCYRHHDCTDSCQISCCGTGCD